MPHPDPTTDLNRASGPWTICRSMPIKRQSLGASKRQNPSKFHFSVYTVPLAHRFGKRDATCAQVGSAARLPCGQPCLVTQLFAARPLGAGCREAKSTLATEGIQGGARPLTAAPTGLDNYFSPIAKASAAMSVSRVRPVKQVGVFLPEAAYPLLYKDASVDMPTCSSSSLFVENQQLYSFFDPLELQGKASEVCLLMPCCYLPLTAQEWRMPVVLGHQHLALSQAN